MTERTKEKEKVREEGGPPASQQCDRSLLCPDEWEDPAGRKVLGEYHKEGLPYDAEKVEADLEEFERYWRSGGVSRAESEYHKEGAPYLWEQGDAREEKVVAREAARRVEELSEAPSPAIEMAQEGSRPEASLAESKVEGAAPRIQRPIDLSTLEVIAYALFRVIFGKGVRIPIRRENLVDMEVTVRGKDVIVDTKQLYFAIPELAVWRIIYAHKGVPILEFGRGVKKGLRVHRIRALFLALEIWKGSRNRKAVSLNGHPAVPEIGEEEYE